MHLVRAASADLPAVVDLLNLAYRSAPAVAGRAWSTEAGYIVGDRMTLPMLAADLDAKPEARVMLWIEDGALAGCVWLEPAPSSSEAVGRQNPSNSEAIGRQNPSSSEAIGRQDPSSSEAIGRQDPSSSEAVGHQESFWYLGMLTVRPDLQAAGAGRRLLEAAEGEARALGARRIRMTVVNVRGGLIAWYERRGYARTGEILPFPYDDLRFGAPTRPDLSFVVLERPVG